MEWMIMPLKRYADFTGRSQRIEYWMFVLFICLVMFAGVVVGILLSEQVAYNSYRSEMTMVAVFALIGLFYLAILIPLIAVQVRRFHDQDLSGWLVLLGFIPYIGGLIIFVFMCIDGTPGTNSYGPDPKGRGDHDARIFA